ncbi:MAG TPA: hypothetical protein VE338_09010 [Ktedonobacterales bacterium]|jgi:hypothetical protein|nr:hypothetical protein [Ktedonobacterales bacterium]
MFPVAHGWLLAQLTEEPTPAGYLGCVWPDMLFGSPLTHPQSHKSGAELLAFARALPANAEREAFIAFTRGVITHGSEPRGFDWFSDEGYGDAGAHAKGYAFQRAAPLAARAAVVCGVPEEMGLWKAHNLIEMAFERALYAANIPAAQSLAAACANLELMARMSELLARYFAHEPAALAESMRRYAEMVALAPTSLDALAEAYTHQTRYRHPGAEPDASAIAALIGEAETIIAADRDAYLSVCLAGVRSTLAAYDI